MRKKNTQMLNEIIGDVLKKFLEMKIVNSWEDVVGTYIYKSTQDIYVSDQKLFVKINSSIIKKEVMLISKELLNRLNQKVGAEIIKEIVLK